MSTISKEIYLDAPNIGRPEIEYLGKAIDSGYISTAGPFVTEFEKRFSSYLKVKRSVSTQSGTAALHIVLYALGIGKGDEVIVPALTFVATVNPVMYVGATPVFADVDSRTWNIDPDEIEKNITKKTRVIIPVHFYGNPCDMDAIMRIAKKHDLYVIEDATESLGALYKRRQIGTIGDFGCFSFNGNKVITTGGGGMVTSRREKILQRIKFLVNQARDESKGYFHPEIGFNYRMTNIEAALGISQMKRLEKFLLKKKKFSEIYMNELRNIDEISFQKEYDGAESSRWFTCILFSRAISILLLQKKLAQKDIPTRKIFMPITEFPPYIRYKREGYKNSYEIYAHGLSLPSSTANSEMQIYYVCKIVKEILRKK